MIAGSVADNVGLSTRQLQIILVEKCADCRFAGFRLQVATATDGIGRETARQLLNRGFRVLVHGRTLEKAQRVVAEFQRAQPGAAAAAVYADLARMPAVVALAGQIKQQTPVLDVLIHNAGVYQHQRQLTAEGFEVTLAVNHLAPFVLTQQVLPLLGLAHETGKIVR